MRYTLNFVNPNLPVSVAKASSYGPCIYQIEPPAQRFVKIDEYLYSRIISSICNKCELHTSEILRRSHLSSAAVTLIHECADFLINIIDESICKEFAESAIQDLNLIAVDTYQELVNQSKLYLSNEDYKYTAYLSFIWASKSYLTHLINFLGIQKSEIPFISRESINTLISANTELKHLCLGYNESNGVCKKDKITGSNNFPCHTDYIRWVYSLDNDRYYSYSLTYNTVVALPNIYGDGQVCWGNVKLTGLKEVYLFWESYFNSDLALAINSRHSTEDIIESLSLNLDDFEEDEDGYRSLGDIELDANDLVKILSTGGINQCSQRAPIFETYFSYTQCKAVLVLTVNKQLEGLTNDYNNRSSINSKVYLFLMNETEPDVWEAVLPSIHGREYDKALIINLNELKSLAP